MAAHIRNGCGTKSPKGTNDAILARMMFTNSFLSFILNRVYIRSTQ